MAISRSAYRRYKVIDSLLRNTMRPYPTIIDIQEACQQVSLAQNLELIGSLLDFALQMSPSVMNGLSHGVDAILQSTDFIPTPCGQGRRPLADTDPLDCDQHAP